MRRGRFQQVENSLQISRFVAIGGIACPPVGNLTRADPTERREGRKRHRCDGKEDGAL
jgi:hypothetical protein